MCLAKLLANLRRGVIGAVSEFPRHSEYLNSKKTVKLGYMWGNYKLLAIKIDIR